MARRKSERPGNGGPPPGPSVPSSSRAGVRVPLDSPLYTSFTLLEAQPAYRMVMTMESTDAKFAQMTAQGLGMSPGELTVQGGTWQFVMHMRMPATDVKGTIDDWEIRSVVRDGRAARLITSRAVPRYLKLAEDRLAAQLAILDREAAMSVARAAAEGPWKQLAQDRGSPTRRGACGSSPIDEKGKRHVLVAMPGRAQVIG
jgi:hypothetical protein